MQIRYWPASASALADPAIEAINCTAATGCAQASSDTTNVVDVPALSETVAGAPDRTACPTATPAELANESVGWVSVHRRLAVLVIW